MLPWESVSYEEFLTREVPGSALVISKAGVLFGFSVDEYSDSAKCLSERIIERVRNFSARNKLSEVFSIVSVGLPGATTIRGNSP